MLRDLHHTGNGGSLPSFSDEQLCNLGDGVINAAAQLVDTLFRAMKGVVALLYGSTRRSRSTSISISKSEIKKVGFKMRLFSKCSASLHLQLFDAFAAVSGSSFNSVVTHNCIGECMLGLLNTLAIHPESQDSNVFHGFRPTVLSKITHICASQPNVCGVKEVGCFCFYCFDERGCYSWARSVNECLCEWRWGP
jgi:hypothetical protein